MKHLDRKGSNRKQIGKFSMKSQEIPQNYIFWGPKYPIKVSPKISNFQSIITTNICLNLSLSLMDSLINSYINENYDDIESQVIYFKSNVKHSHNNTLGIFNTDESIVNFFGKKNGINWNVFIPTAQIIIMCIATYFLTIYPLFIERIKGFKQQQYYAGVSPFLYWISNFIADTIIGIIVFSSLIVLFGFLNEDANFLPFFQATCIYFFMNLPIFYCLTFFGKYFSNTCGFLGIIFLTLQGLMCIVFEKNNITENEYNEKNKSYVWKIIKTYMNPFTILYKIQIARYYGNENDKKNANYLMNLPIGLPITIVYILILFSFLILIECGVLILGCYI
uniref:ABC2_membrane domain-containing protein n=1 Tax=Strongyloides papillosus TaxID=174720 RepID=A0A0N5CDU6_STREA